MRFSALGSTPKLERGLSFRYSLHIRTVLGYRSADPLMTIRRSSRGGARVVVSAELRNASPVPFG